MRAIVVVVVAILFGAWVRSRVRATEDAAEPELLQHTIAERSVFEIEDGVMVKRQLDPDELAEIRQSLEEAQTTLRNARNHFGTGT